MPRQLSQNPATVERRERRIMADINRQERELHKEINALMEKGMSFDEAWVAAGGMIIDDEQIKAMRQRGELKDFLDSVIR